MVADATKGTNITLRHEEDETPLDMISKANINTTMHSLTCCTYIFYNVAFRPGVRRSLTSFLTCANSLNSLRASNIAPLCEFSKRAVDLLLGAGTTPDTVVANPWLSLQMRVKKRLCNFEGDLNLDSVLISLYIIKALR